MIKIFTKIVIDMETLKVIERYGYIYDGPVAYAAAAALPLIGMGVSLIGSLFGHSGPSDAEKAAAKSDFQFTQTMQNEQSTQFANNQDALDTLKKAWDPIAKGGAYQYGFSSPEDAALRSSIENAGATATTNTVAAEELRQQQESGGADTMPTGANAALDTIARETGAQKTATELGNEKLAGYAQGHQNFTEATSAEAKIAELSNPTAYADAAVNASKQGLESQKNIDTQNANSMTSKLMGGIAGGFANLDTTGSSTGAEQASSFMVGASGKG